MNQKYTFGTQETIETSSKRLLERLKGQHRKLYDFLLDFYDFWDAQLEQGPVKPGLAMERKAQSMYLHFYMI